MFCVSVHRSLQSLRAPSPSHRAEVTCNRNLKWVLWSPGRAATTCTPLTADPEHLSQFSIYLGEVRIDRGLSLHGHGCAGTHFVDHTDLKLTAWLPHLDRFPFLRSKFYFMDSVSGEVFFKRSFTTKIWCQSLGSQNMYFVFFHSQLALSSVWYINQMSVRLSWEQPGS